MKKLFFVLAVLAAFTFTAQAADNPVKTIPALEQVAETANAIIIAENNAILFEAYSESGTLAKAAFQESVCSGQPPAPNCHCEITMHFSSSYPFYWETAAWKCPGAQGKW